MTIYDNIQSQQEQPSLFQKNTFKITFTLGAKVEISGNYLSTYKVVFIDTFTNRVLHHDFIKTNQWSKCSYEYFIWWRVEVYEGEILVASENFDPTHKNIKIEIDSSSLGDTIAWFPYLEQFRLLNNCQVYASTFFNYLFQKEYPEIRFITHSTIVGDLYAHYKIGLYYFEDNKFNYYMNPNNPLEDRMQKICSDILGLQYEEIRPKITKRDLPKEKQVTFAMFSTSQAKFWNRENGWQEIVDYLLNEGYVVKLLSSEDDNFMGNKIPNGVTRVPKGHLDNIIDEIVKSQFFIGIGSGLTWLSWALNTPTILISGFSGAISEMRDCYRISTPDGFCNNCFSKHRLDINDWNWCPNHKDSERQYECSKEITPLMVINAIEQIKGNL